MLLLAYAVAALFGGGRKDEGGKAEGGKAEGGKAPSPPFLPGRIGERLVSTDAELQAAVGDPAISLVTFAVERIELSQTLELQHDVTLVGPVVLDAGAEPSPSLCGDTLLIMAGFASFVEQRVVAVHEGVNAAAAAAVGAPPPQRGPPSPPPGQRRGGGGVRPRRAPQTQPPQVDARA